MRNGKQLAGAHAVAQAEDGVYCAPEARAVSTPPSDLIEFGACDVIELEPAGNMCKGAGCGEACLRTWSSGGGEWFDYWWEKGKEEDGEGNLKVACIEASMASVASQVFALAALD
ncbi:hypothetical protein E2562_034919 [Oryza meyeriana var. granulata]|uniref:Uncharacterized protein n=1 Tax=Oryza meyeriana var. granulata TaxID=110450 RepID=A0A6G1F1F5_9ORYZ|nr:hypothetical protein E2562_034919 [Oryza meyeriana var. granulata]